MALKDIIDVQITLLGVGGGTGSGGSQEPALAVTGATVTVQGTEHHLTYTVGGSEYPATTYQWTLNGEDIVGATSSSYTPPIDMVGYLGGRITATIGENPVSLAASPIVLPFNIVGGQIVAESDRFVYRMFTSTDEVSVRGTGSCEALVLAGGGAGGPFSGESGDPMAGGGGAGGAIFNPFAVIKGSASPLAIVVGLGGLRSTHVGAGANGESSIAFGMEAFGGGGGGQNDNTSPSTPGQAGGSGGAGAGGAAGSPGAAAGDILAAGQGFPGTTGTAVGTSTFRRGGGAGGFSARGTAATNNNNGNGGPGMKFSNLFGEDFVTVQDLLGLVGAYEAFAGGGAGGTGNTSPGTGGIGGLGGGGNGGYNPGTPVLSTSGSSFGAGGGGAGDNVGTDGEDKGGSGHSGVVIAAIPKIANDVKIRLWIGDDTYRDDDGNPSTTIAAAAARLVEVDSPLVSVGGLVMGDCKRGGQWFLLNPDQPKANMPAAYDDGDDRYANTTQNKMGGGNAWFYHTLLFPALADLFPEWTLCEAYRDGGVDGVHEWNFAPTSSSQILSASLEIANDIIAAINNPLPEIVVYSAGGGANVVAEAVAWIRSSTSYTQQQIADHLAVIQHGRNNWFYGYDTVAGIDARVITRPFTIAITNQNPAVYDNGWAGPSLDTAFRAIDYPLINLAGGFSVDFENVFKTAVGAIPAVGVPADRTFSSTLDISDSGSHVFALCPGRVAANMAARMNDNETLLQGTENQHLIYNTVTLASRTRVLWHGFRRSMACRIACPPAA